MKALGFVLTVVFFGLNLQANAKIYNKGVELDYYKKLVYEKLYFITTCFPPKNSSSGVKMAHSLIEKSDSVLVSEAGSQNINMTFKVKNYASKNRIYKVIVAVSLDGKDIVEIKAIEQSQTFHVVNHGSLVDPKFEKVFDFIGEYDCKSFWFQKFVLIHLNTRCYLWKIITAQFALVKNYQLFW